MANLLRLNIYVEHGREREAADFYSSAFGAMAGQEHRAGGELCGADLNVRGWKLTVAGSNPKREQDASRGGPFHPKGAAAVSTVVILSVPDVSAAMKRAVDAGASVRDRPSPSTEGVQTTSVIDPFGHMWGLLEEEDIPEGAAA